MTKAQIKAFNELIADPNFKGADQLKYLLWLNTTKPKYNIGECFKVTDHARRINGHQVIGFNAKVKKITSTRFESEYRYELEMNCKCNGKEYIASIFKHESELKSRCEDNINIVD